jgi:hypothetical protein
MGEKAESAAGLDALHDLSRGQVAVVDGLAEPKRKVVVAVARGDLEPRQQ